MLTGNWGCLQIPAAISVDITFANDGGGDGDIDGGAAGGGCGRQRVQSGDFAFCSWHDIDDPGGTNVTCAYYNTTELRWRDNGCWLAGVQTSGAGTAGTTRAQCCCNHTTTFAVIIGGGGDGGGGTASTYVAFMIVYVLNSLSALGVLLTAAAILSTPELNEQLR